jgi:thiosulfate/3-mercaptopyruvate sulfurtransferase
MEEVGAKKGTAAALGLTKSFVVSPEWLSEHLDEPQLVVVDCRFSLTQPQLGQEQYAAGHLPGARYLDLNRDLSSPVRQHGGRHPLPEIAQLAATLSAIGVASQPPTIVVAYDDSRLAFAARLWWLLRYLGHDRVAVLDGGWSGWLAAGYPTTTDVPVLQSAVFVPQPQPDRVVDYAMVKARIGLPSVVLVDAREPERYRGEREPIDPVAGQIPGAVNYPWQSVTSTDGKVKSQSEYQSDWAEIAPPEKTAEIIVYCGSGVTACVDLLALELAGRSGKLYAGSWSDWCSYLG